MNPGTDEPRRPLRVHRPPPLLRAEMPDTDIGEMVRPFSWQGSPVIMRYVVARTGSGTNAVREVVARAVHALIATVPDSSPLTEKDVIAGLLAEAATRTRGAPDLRADTTLLWRQCCPATHEEGTSAALADVAAASAAVDEDIPDGTSGHNFRREANAAQLAADKVRRGTGLTWFHITRASFWHAMAQTDHGRLRAALVTLAANVVAWIENLDRREGR